MAKAETGKYGVCSRCGRKVLKDEICVIDGDPVCTRCIYGGQRPFRIYPIGVVKNGLARAKKGFGTSGKEGLSRIELLPSQGPFLYGLEREKTITVVYYLHESGPVSSVFKRGLDGKMAGIFASRTPYRLSRIGIQDVKLVKVKGTILYVEGLDAVNGTPVLDIKMRWSALKDGKRNIPGRPV